MSANHAVNCVCSFWIQSFQFEQQNSTWNINHLILLQNHANQFQAVDPTCQQIKQVNQSCQPEKSGRAKHLFVSFELCLFSFCHFSEWNHGRMGWQIVVNKPPHLCHVMMIHFIWPCFLLFCDHHSSYVENPKQPLWQIIAH